jgi:hypothetical protein
MRAPWRIRDLGDIDECDVCTYIPCAYSTRRIHRIRTAVADAGCGADDDDVSSIALPSFPPVTADGGFGAVEDDVPTASARLWCAEEWWIS